MRLWRVRYWRHVPRPFPKDGGTPSGQKGERVHVRPLAEARMNRP